VNIVVILTLVVAQT